VTEPQPVKQPPEPLVVSPAVAGAMLAVGQTRLYEMLAAGELESYCVGRARRIMMASIRRYIDTRLAADAGRKPKPYVRRDNLLG
jgi:excisionase family DNA binding protein